jgi:hypothetical protein
MGRVGPVRESAAGSRPSLKTATVSACSPRGVYNRYGRRCDRRRRHWRRVVRLQAGRTVVKSGEGSVGWDGNAWRPHRHLHQPCSLNWRKAAAAAAAAAACFHRPARRWAVGTRRAPQRRPRCHGSPAWEGDRLRIVWAKRRDPATRSLQHDEPPCCLPRRARLPATEQAVDLPGWTMGKGG